MFSGTMIEKKSLVDSPVIQFKRLLLMSRGLAQYRLKLATALSEAFGGNVQIVVSPSPIHTGLWEVDWEELKERKGDLLFREISSVSVSDYCKAIIRRFNYPADPPSLRGKRLSISEIHPDIIAIHEYSWFMVKLAIYSRIAGVPCIVFTDLGIETRRDQVGLRTRFYHKLASWLTDGQIANTKEATLPYGAKHRPVFFLPHAVDTQEFPQKPPTNEAKEINLLMVGQYIPRKGADLLIKALSLVMRRTSQKFRLRLVGNQPDDWVRGVIKEAGLEAVVDVVGIRQGADLIREYHRADIFILSSRFDTYGVVVHEAASCGLPLLISRYAGAAKAMIDEGVNGWTIDPEETETFGNRIQSLIESQDIRKKMGIASRKIAERLCIRVQTKTLAKQLGVLTSKKSGLHKT